MSAEAERFLQEDERFAQLRQKGFVQNATMWKEFREEHQQQLLGVLRNDPQATVLL